MLYDGLKTWVGLGSFVRLGSHLGRVFMAFVLSYVTYNRPQRLGIGGFVRMTQVVHGRQQNLHAIPRSNENIRLTS